MPGSGANVDARISVNEANIKRLENTVYGNGQPGLEAKMMSAISLVEGKLVGHIERVERHGKANMEQGDGELAHELEEERKQRERMHEETNTAREKDKLEAKEERKEMSKKIDRLMYVMGGLNGALLMFKVLEDMGWIHVATGVAK